MTNCSGLMHCYVLPAVAVSGTLTRMNQNNVEDQLNPLTSGYEITMLSKPIGSKAHGFLPAASVVDTMSDFDWSILVFEITGGAISTTIGNIEVVQNVEFQLNSAAVSTTGLGGVTTAPRASNPVALAAQSSVHTSVPSIIHGGLEKLDKTITTAASNAVDSLLDSAMSYGMRLLTLL